MMRDGLISALVKENIPVSFIEDPILLNARVLDRILVLIIARNGRYWPDGYGKPQTAWMTDEQQKAIWGFVEKGGGFLGGPQCAHDVSAERAVLQAIRRRFRRTPEALDVHIRVENKKSSDHRGRRGLRNLR